MSSKELIDVLKDRQQKDPDEVLKERAERLVKTIELKEPDRVPLMFFTCGHAFARWFKLSEVYFDYIRMREATVKFALEFPSDALITSPTAGVFILPFVLSEAPDVAPFVRFLTGPMHDILRDKYTRWPGRELSDHLPFEFLGGKFMEPEEYDKLIENPVEFVVNTILPRVCHNLAKPGSVMYFQTLARLGVEGVRYIDTVNNVNASLAKIGYPALSGTFAYAPLDLIGDFLRHPTNTMLDIRRYPDKVKPAVNSLIKPILGVALALKPVGAQLAFIPLHLNEMLSPKLYNEFYWPTLKKVITELLNNGIKSFVLFEGDHTPHLETILELPKGWGIGFFEKADIRKTREILDGHTCVAGGIPIALLMQATPLKIEEYVKKLIKDAALGGGFILGPGVAEIDPAIPEVNLRALINAVLKYGEYKQ